VVFGSGSEGSGITAGAGLRRRARMGARRTSMMYGGADSVGGVFDGRVWSMVVVDEAGLEVSGGECVGGGRGRSGSKAFSLDVDVWDNEVS
jgi:hypothetical protein